MELWGVTMVKDEIDVIEFTLRHLAGQGVDRLLVADNLSTDGTRELLERLSGELPLMVVDDPEVGYYQSRKMSALVETARVAGATHVIPFDADECWWSSRGTLRDAVRRAHSPIVKGILHNYFPTSHDDPAEVNPFRRITRREAEIAPLPKVAVEAVEGITIHQGNHGATYGAAQPAASTLRIGHFPWRSFEQFAKKVRNGYRAYQATDLPDEVGAHWRSYGGILEASGEDVLRTEVWDVWFFDPPTRTVVDPVPYAG